MGDYQKAKENYLESLDLSGETWHRASVRSNNVVRRVCIEEEVGLADLSKAFMDTTYSGLLGREQFLDNCHWRGEYYFLAAKVIIKEMTQSNEIYSQIFRADRYEPDLLSCKFISLAERGKSKDSINQASTIAIWKVVESGEMGREADDELQGGLSEEAVSYFKTLYLMNPNELWNLQFSEEKIKKMLSKHPLVNDFISNSIIFERNWPLIIYHIGETYRRLKLYKEALVYFNNAITLDKNSYLPYLGQSLTYYALGEKSKAHNSIKKAEELSESIEVKYYKNILGLQ